MTKALFQGLTLSIGLLFAVAFGLVVLPPVVESGDVFAAAAAGFVNPYASGYALDAIATGLILVAWIIYERSTRGVRHGWVCIILCIIPGVATALALYLLLRARQRVC